MRGTLTTFSALSIIGIKVVKIDNSFLVWCRYFYNSFFYHKYYTWFYWHQNHNCFFFLLFDFSDIFDTSWSLIILILSFLMPFVFLFLISLLKKLVCFGNSRQDRLYFLIVSSSKREFLGVVSWVYIWKVLLLEKIWLFGQ